MLVISFVYCAQWLQKVPWKKCCDCEQHLTWPYLHSDLSLPCWQEYLHPRAYVQIVAKQKSHIAHTYTLAWGQPAPFTIHFRSFSASLVWHRMPCNFSQVTKWIARRAAASAVLLLHRYFGTSATTGCGSPAAADSVACSMRTICYYSSDILRVQLPGEPSRAGCNNPIVHT